MRFVDRDDALSDIVEYGAQVRLVGAQLLQELGVANGVGGQGAHRVEELAIGGRKRISARRAGQADPADDLTRAA